MRGVKDVKSGYAKRVYKHEFEIDGDKVYTNIYKRGKTVYVRERKSGLIIARSRKYNTKSIITAINASKSRDISHKVSTRTGEEKRNISLRKPLININDYKLEKYKKGYKTTTKRVKKGYVGQLHMRVLFIGANRQRKTVEGSATGFYDLADKADYERAYNRAFSGALSQIDFSYTKADVIWIHYSYYLKND